MANETMKLRRTSSDVQVGTAGTGVSVVEKASGVFRVTEITIPATTLITTTAAAKGDGLLLYTLPAGTIDLQKCAMHVYLTGSTNIVADTPEVALGTTKATGAIATLGASDATMENVFGPHVISGAIPANGTGGALNLSGGAGTTANNAFGKLFVGTDTRTIYLNIADTFAGVGTVTAEGKVYLTWIAL